MDYGLILKGIGALSLIGAIAAAMLALASRRFHVDVDERVENIFEVLPGANCGACGNPSCFAVAESIADGTKPISACVAGGANVVDAIADVMGVEPVGVETVVSVRHCGGGSRASRRYEYAGATSCNSQAKLAGGGLSCAAGCLGLGDCAAACPFDAITMDDRGLPVIDPAKCTGCEICVPECPRGVLETVRADAPVVVRCGAHTKAKQRKADCPVCCIACKKCEKECPEDAIHVVDLLAVIDYEKCTGCGVCVDVCPQRCIDLTPRASGRPAAATDGKGPDVPGFSPRRPEPVGAPSADEPRAVADGAS